MQNSTYQDEPISLAIDIGASGGKCLAAWLSDNRLQTREVHSFKNQAIASEGRLIWDIDALEQEIISGIQKSIAQDLKPTSIGIDTWGTDFALLDEEQELLTPIVCYRDDRTLGVPEKVEQKLSFEKLYARTGIQKQNFNTIYQLYAFKEKQAELFKKAKSLLLVPDYLHYRLTGKMSQEITNASTTALVNAKTRTWDEDIITALGFPQHLFSELNQPGTLLAPVRESLAKELGHSFDVYLPATHDTASAYLAAPLMAEDTIVISSGTWSLIGISTTEPILSDEARNLNYTNEIGFASTVRFLKNIMGLWIIQSLRQEIAPDLSFDAIEDAARNSSYQALIDVNDQRFFAPESMKETIQEVCIEAGYAAPTSLGDYMSVIYLSLAHSYAKAIQELSEVTGHAFKRINIVGGGSRDRYLNELTATFTGLPVYAGPAESSSIGNVLAQAIGRGEINDVQQAREIVQRSFEIKLYES